MAYKLFGSRPKRKTVKTDCGKTCHQPWYGFKHVIFEILQLRSLITAGFSAVFLVSFLTGRLEHWDTSTALFIPILTMILNSLFRKDKGD